MDILRILFRLCPGAKRPSSKESAIFTAKKTKQTNTHTHKRQAYIYIYYIIFTYLYFKKIYIHTRDKHVRLHKITQVPPKQHNSGTPSISLTIHWKCMETAAQCAPFAPVPAVEFRCTAMSYHYLGGYDRMQMK